MDRQLAGFRCGQRGTKLFHRHQLLDAVFVIDARAEALMFTSYAQNFEDVMLRRALNRVARGFYIDVGAQDRLSTR